MNKRNITISKKQYFLLIVAIISFRLFFTAFQRATLLPDISMLDDFLVYQAARNISAGKWLGAYGFMTIGKHMLFSVWLALLNSLKIPYLIAGQVLHVISSVLLIESLSPAINNRLYRMGFLFILVFNPASYANFTLRVYRDNITTSVFMLVFASIIGFALRTESKKELALWLYGALGGLSLGASFLLREDGIWILPLVLVGVIISVRRIVKLCDIRKLNKLAALSVMLILSLVSVGIYCFMNYIHYGRFIISDMTSKEFYAACGAMTRVVVPEDEFNPIVTLPYSSRKKLYENCPTFAELEQYIESEYFHRMKKDIGGDFEDISGGGYYWAVRNAASLLGHYNDSETARVYYQKLADEINEACDSGAIASTGKRSGLNAPVTVSRLVPTLKETLNGIVSVLFYKDIVCSPEPSVGSDAAISRMESYLFTKSFNLEKNYNENSLIILTAYSTKDPVSVYVTDSNKNEIQFSERYTTGSDVYVEQLLDEGTDTLFTDHLRRYISTYENTDNILINLSAGNESILIEAKPTQGYITNGNITYSVEYTGYDYSETVNADYGFLEIWSYRIMRAVTVLYRIILPVLFAAGIISLILSILKLIKKQDNAKSMSEKILLILIAAGVLLMALLRLTMIAYIEVTAFGIGTNPMYFAIAYPLFIVFSFIGIYTKFNANKI